MDFESEEVRAEREVRAWVATHGIQNLSVGRMVQHFREHTTLRVRMGKKRVLALLRKQLGLRYSKYRVQRIGTTLTELAERRYHVARLLTHLLHESRVVVAVDESAIQVDMHFSKQWQPRPQKATSSTRATLSTTHA